jgi:hypothetical protein
MKAYKSSVTQQRNQQYHDRIVVEDAMRKVYQNRAMLNHNKIVNKEAARERREQKLTDLQNNVKQYNILTGQQSVMKTE